jgi:hypothetical protein
VQVAGFFDFLSATAKGIRGPWRPFPFCPATGRAFRQASGRDLACQALPDIARLIRLGTFARNDAAHPCAAGGSAGLSVELEPAQGGMMAKKALLVGLNHYPDPENTLRGCLNDVRQVHDLLHTHFGFADNGAVQLLTDVGATTSAIVSRLRWLVDDASAGDVLVFHYSGHGSQVPDRNGDEVDGLDEIICPYDLDWDNPFTDDDLYAIIQGLPASVNLTVILDSCHSGTGLREPAVGGGSVRSRCLRPPERMQRRFRKDMAMRRFGARAAECNAILIAGCRSDQASADADIDGAYHGALTYYLCRALEDLSYAGTYRAVVERARRLLRQNGYEQVPQLEGPASLLNGQVLAPRLERVSALSPVRAMDQSRWGGGNEAPRQTHCSER